MKNSIEIYKQIFGVINTSNSGKISVSELQHALRTLQIDLSRDVLKQMIQLVDRDQDGYLCLEEFAHFLFICDNGRPNDLKSILFLASDDQYSFKIGPKRFQAITQRIGVTVDDNELDEIFKQHADLGKEMSYERFMQVVGELENHKTGMNVGDIRRIRSFLDAKDIIKNNK